MQAALLVKIFDLDKKLLGKGSLKSISTNTISIQGDLMPSLPSKKMIILHIHDDLRGILIFECEISISTTSQLNARIVKKLPTLERRKALKMKTDHNVPLRLLLRNDRSINKDEPINIKILNMSIGGILITSNTDFFIGDVLVFTFDYYPDFPLELDATVVRIDQAADGRTTNNYGCVFSELSRRSENVICKYLYERQIQIYSKK